MDTEVKTTETTSEITSEQTSEIKTTQEKEPKTGWGKFWKRNRKGGKKKFKMPSSMAIILGLLVAVIILTWIPHDSWYEYTASVSYIYEFDGVNYYFTAEGEALYNALLTSGYDDTAAKLADPLENPSLYYIRGIENLLIQDFLESSYNPGLEAYDFLAPDVWYAELFGSTWFAPVTGTYGFFNIINAIFAGFLDAMGVIIFLFAIGGFIEVMLASGSLESGVKALTRKTKGKELILIPILFVLFAIGGTTYGMQEETIGFFPIIVPFLVFAGFDVMTGFLVIVLGTTTGIMVSIVNPFSVGVMADSLAASITGVDISVGTGIIGRIIAFTIVVTIGASLMTWYAARVKKDPSKSFIAADKEANEAWASEAFTMSEDSRDEKMSRKQVIALWLFGLTFTLMILAMIPWPDLIAGINPDIWVPLFSWINGFEVFGWWYYAELFMLFMIMAVILGLIFKMSAGEIRKHLWNGIKAMWSVAVIIGVARGISIVLTYSGFSYWLIGLMIPETVSINPSGFALMFFPIFFFMALLIPSTSGLASATGGFVGATIETAYDTAEDKELAAAGILLSYSMAVGIVNMFTPTQGIVYAQAEASNLTYGKVVKPLLYYAGIMTVIAIILIPSITALGGLAMY